MLERLIWQDREVLGDTAKVRGRVFFVGRGQSLIDWASLGVGVIQVSDPALAERSIAKLLPEANFIFVTQDLAAGLEDRIIDWNQTRHCVVVLPTPAQQGLGGRLISDSVKAALGVDIVAKEVN